MKRATEKIRLAVPKGRQQAEIVSLLADAGLSISVNPKGYRPACSDNRFEVKLLKAANIPKLVEYGAHDLGITGHDWIEETGAEVVELLDTGLLPVRLVAAAPKGSDPFAVNNGQSIIVASEYENITRKYMESRACEYRYLRTYGATEVFPPEDADLIVDNTATGAALRSNGLVVIDEILRSSTRLIACKETVANAARREVIDEVVMLVSSVLEGRLRVLLDMNVAADALDRVIELLPAMKSPTVQPLRGDLGFAVRVAVLRSEVPQVLPAILRAGATDILQTALQKVVA
jgi:ATP phosphoribosyltransferase